MFQKCHTLRHMTAFFIFLSAIVLSLKEANADTEVCKNYYSVITKEKRSHTRGRLLDVKKSDPQIEEINAILKDNIIGQPQMIDILTSILVRAKAGIQRRATLGNILIYGPTGVGKTRSVEFLADLIGGNIIQIEGGDYSKKGDIAGITGSTPTHVGHGVTLPILTPQRIENARGKKIPATIILINEIEKAHPDFLKWWLATLDKGTAEVWMPNENSSTSNFNSGGSSVILDLKNTIIIATTNAAAEVVKVESENLMEKIRQTNPEELKSADGVGNLMTRYDQDNLFRLQDDARAALLSAFELPEFLGRWDNIVAAYPLLPKGYYRVLNLEIERISRQFQNAKIKRNIKIRLTKRARQWVLSNMDHNFGARNLSKLADSLIELPIINAIVNDEISDSVQIAIDLNEQNNELSFFSQDHLKNKFFPKRNAVDSEGESKSGGEGKSERKVSKEEKKIQFQKMNSITSPKEKLNAINDYVNENDINSPEEVAKILEIIPTGINWGWTNPTEYFPNKVFSELGFKKSLQTFELMDLSILFKLLYSLEKTPTKTQKVAIRNTATNIVTKSLKLTRDGVTDDYKMTLLLAIEALLN